MMQLEIYFQDNLYLKLEVINQDISHLILMEDVVMNVKVKEKK